MIKIKRFIGGALEANGYVIYHHDGGQGYIIDPGYNAGWYKDFLVEHDLHIKAILLTHHHYDHVGAVDKLRGDLNCPVYLHRADLPMYKGEVDRVLDGGEVLSFDDEELVVIHSPGHTKGGVCYFSERSRVVFTGDTIFNVDIGRTDLPGDGEPYVMKDTMNNVVNKWDNDIVIYPGHGDSANMKYVRKHNFEFIEALDD